MRSSLRDVPRANPTFVEPMKALLVSDLPQGRDWVYEIKFDGYRVVTIKLGQTVRLYSRNAKDLTERYAELVPALQSLPAKQCALDGEVVAVDETGRSSFQLLQLYQSPGESRPPLVYYVFDLLNLDGKSLLRLPLVERQKLLHSLLCGAADPIRLSSPLEATPQRLLREMQSRGFEGMIAKLKNSTYEPGRRSGAWTKFKWSSEQEFVIGGFSPPKGGRAYFGALLVGYYEGEKLLFASKVGSGFNTQQLAALHRCFQTYAQPQCPFANLPERPPNGVTAAAMRRCTWLKPELVCQVRFTEWTRDRHLRHPLFLGLREDKNAREVVREQPQL